MQTSVVGPGAHRPESANPCTSSQKRSSSRARVFRCFASLWRAILDVRVRYSSFHQLAPFLSGKRVCSDHHCSGALVPAGPVAKLPSCNQVNNVVPADGSKPPSPSRDIADARWAVRLCYCIHSTSLKEGHEHLIRRTLCEAPSLSDSATLFATNTAINKTVGKVLPTLGEVSLAFAQVSTQEYFPYTTQALGCAGGPTVCDFTSHDASKCALVVGKDNVQ